MALPPVPAGFTVESELPPVPEGFEVASFDAAAFLPGVGTSPEGLEGGSVNPIDALEAVRSGIGGMAQAALPAANEYASQVPMSIGDKVAYQLAASDLSAKRAAWERQKKTFPVEEAENPTPALDAVVRGLSGRPTIRTGIMGSYQEARGKAALAEETQQQDEWHAKVEQATELEGQNREVNHYERLARGAEERAATEPEGPRKEGLLASAKLYQGKADDARQKIYKPGVEEETIVDDAADVGRKGLSALAAPARAVGGAVASFVGPYSENLSAWEESKKAFWNDPGARGWSTVSRAAQNSGVNPISMLVDTIYHDLPEAERAEIHEQTHEILGATAEAAADPLMVGKIGALNKYGKAAKLTEEGKRLAELRGALAYKPPKKLVSLLEKLPEAERTYDRGSIAGQFGKGHRDLVSVFGINLIPRKAAAVIGAAIDAPLDAVRKGKGVVPRTISDAARGVRATGLLSLDEQDALTMKYLSEQERKAMSSAVGVQWAADAKELRDLRGTFNRAFEKGQDAAEAQRGAMLQTFEEGRKGDFDLRVAEAVDKRIISPDEGKYLVRVREKMEALIKREQKVGVDVEYLDNDELTYLHHATTEEFKKELVDRARQLGLKGRGLEEYQSQWLGQMKEAFQKQRSSDLSILDANAFAQSRGFKSQMFHTDMPTIVAARELASIRATSMHDLLKRLGDRFGADVPAGVAKDVDKFGRPMIKAFAEELAGKRSRFVMAENDVWREIQKDPRRFLGAVTSEQEARRMIKEARSESRRRLAAFERVAQNEGDAAALDAYLKSPHGWVDDPSALGTYASRAEWADVAGYAEAHALIDRFAKRGKAPPSGLIDRAQQYLERVRANSEAAAERIGSSLGKAEDAAAGVIERAAVAEGVYRDIAPRAFAEGNAAKGVEAAGARKGLGRAKAMFKGRDISREQSSYQRLMTSAEELRTLEGMPEATIIFDKGPLKGKAMPVSIANVVQEMQEAMKPEVIGALKKTFMAYNNWWKTWSLSPRPGFHARNFAGNLWNNALAGVYDPRDYAWAFVAQANKGHKVMDTVVLDGITLRELVGEAEALGVTKTQFSGGLERMREQVMREVGEKVSRTMPKEVLHQIQRVAPMLSVDEATNLWLKAGTRVGDTIEQNARLAHYFAKRKAGLSAEQAAMSVKRYLFDYSELSSQERALRDWAIPFYGWMRNNIPLQIEGLLTKPHLFANVGRYIRAQEDPNAPDPELYPAWMRRAGLVRKGKLKDGTAEAGTLSGYWPGWDATRLGGGEGNPLADFGPLVNSFVSLATGVNTFTGRPISGRATRGIPDKTENFFGYDVPASVAYYGRKLLPVFATEIERSNPFGLAGRSPKSEGGIAPSKMPWSNSEGRDIVDPDWKDRLSQYLIGARTRKVDLQKEGEWRFREADKGRLEAIRAAKKYDEEGFKNRAAKEQKIADSMEAKMKRVLDLYGKHGLDVDTR